MKLTDYIKPKDINIDLVNQIEDFIYGDMSDPDIDVDIIFLTNTGLEVSISEEDERIEEGMLYVLHIGGEYQNLFTLSEIESAIKDYRAALKG